MTVIRSTLRTPLTLEETRARLAAATDGPFSPFGRKPVYGAVRQYTAGLYRRRRLNNPFRIRMGVVFEPEDEGRGRGTLLHCTATIDALGRMILVLATCVLTGVVVVISQEQGAASPAPWITAVVGALSIGLIYALGRALSAEEPDKLKRFLIRTLDARPAVAPRDD